MAHGIGGLTAQDVIRRLDLKPHPEGGYFRETFRDPLTDANGRPVSTAIYYLLGLGEVSEWQSRRCHRDLALSCRRADGDQRSRRMAMTRRRAISGPI